MEASLELRIRRFCRRLSDVAARLMLLLRPHPSSLSTSREAESHSKWVKLRGDKTHCSTGTSQRKPEALFVQVDAHVPNSNTCKDPECRVLVGLLVARRRWSSLSNPSPPHCPRPHNISFRESRQRDAKDFETLFNIRYFSV